MGCALSVVDGPANNGMPLTALYAAADAGVVSSGWYRQTGPFSHTHVVQTVFEEP